jgi:hypothetical protein
VRERATLKVSSLLTFLRRLFNSQRNTGIGRLRANLCSRLRDPPGQAANDASFLSDGLKTRNEVE